MNLDSTTVERIVAGVLNQLATGRVSAPVDLSAQTEKREGSAEPVKLAADVVTAEVLLKESNGHSRIIVSERAVVTPAAWDAAKERGVEIVRSPGSNRDDCPGNTTSDGQGSVDAASSLLCVVRNTDAVDRIWDDLKTDWRRELLGCPDDAAALAISAVCRSEAGTIVILAEQAHRAACLANRNERVKAVAIQDSGDVRTIRQQLRANIWCLDPTGRSWFELRNLFRAVAEY
jgi:hypothetical protein